MSLSIYARGLRRLSSLQCVRMYSSSCNINWENKDDLMTIKEVTKKLSEMICTKMKWGEKLPEADTQVMQEVAKSQAELPKRRPSDSLVKAYIPLSKLESRGKYLLTDGAVRFGRLLEDFDTLAGLICYNHNKNPELGDSQKSPYAFVTVLVDRIERSLTQPKVASDKDIFMHGSATWVGTSSIECTMYMEQEIDGRIQQFLSAKYLFVARNPVTNTAGFVNPLEPETAEEKAAFKLGEANKKIRQLESQKSLLKTPPTEEERLIIHQLFLSSIDQQSGSFKVRVKPENSVWMKDTTLKSLIICHPERRNLYNKIFGGFLMMKAYELAYATVAIYTKSRPGMCKIVDDILFKKPVEIGSLLFLSAQVVYTKAADVQVHVHAEVVNPTEGTHETTNDFHFTFGTGIPNVPSVMPMTYAESMRYLVGKRHYES